MIEGLCPGCQGCAEKDRHIAELAAERAEQAVQIQSLRAWRWKRVAIRLRARVVSLEQDLEQWHHAAGSSAGRV